MKLTGSLLSVLDPRRARAPATAYRSGNRTSAGLAGSGARGGSVGGCGTRAVRSCPRGWRWCRAVASEGGSAQRDPVRCAATCELHSEGRVSGDALLPCQPHSQVTIWSRWRYSAITWRGPGSTTGRRGIGDAKAVASGAGASTKHAAGRLAETPVVGKCRLYCIRPEPARGESAGAESSPRGTGRRRARPVPSPATPRSDPAATALGSGTARGELPPRGARRH